MHFLDDTFQPDQREERDVGNFMIYHFVETFEIGQSLNLMRHQLVNICVVTFIEPET